MLDGLHRRALKKKKKPHISPVLGSGGSVILKQTHPAVAAHSGSTHAVKAELLTQGYGHSMSSIAFDIVRLD